MTLLFCLTFAHVHAQKSGFRANLMGGFGLKDITGYQRWAPQYQLPQNNSYYFSGGAEIKVYAKQWGIGYYWDGTFGNGAPRNTFKGSAIRLGRLVEMAENLYFEPSIGIGLSRNKIRFHGNTPDDFKLLNYYTPNAFLRQTALLFSPQLEIFAQKEALIVGLQVGYNWSCLQGNWRYGEMEITFDPQGRPTWWFNGERLNLPKMPADHFYARLMVGIILLED